MFIWTLGPHPTIPDNGCNKQCQPGSVVLEVPRWLCCYRQTKATWADLIYVCPPRLGWPGVLGVLDLLVTACVPSLDID